jgi:hypothetical protein
MNPRPVPTPRSPPTYLARISALETRADASDTRLVSIETTVKEIRDLLVAGRGIAWLVTKIAGGLTGAAIVGGFVIAALRYFNGG